MRLQIRVKELNKQIPEREDYYADQLARQQIEIDKLKQRIVELEQSQEVK